jgi:hypothetical protein
VPQGRAADSNFKLSQAALAKLVDGQVRLLFDPASQAWLMPAQSRAPVTADLFGSAVPASLILPPQPRLAAAAHAKSPVHFPWAFPAFARRDDPSAQIFTQRFHAPSKTFFPNVSI